MPGELPSSENPKEELQPDFLLPDQQPSIEEREGKEYNFDIMNKAEVSMARLVKKLKNNIEDGDYSALLSDDTGGRIPTLVLRKIMLEKGPNKNIKTYFLSAGLGNTPMKFMDDRSEKRKYQKMITYLKNMDFGDKKLLVVTEYMSMGNTLDGIGEALKDIGANFDFAIQSTNEDYDKVDRLTDAFYGEFNAESFVGINKPIQYDNSLMGVLKRGEDRGRYSPIPETIIKHVKNEGRELSEEDINKIFGINSWDDVFTRVHKKRSRIAKKIQQSEDGATNKKRKK
ncbi:MAG: hypothetical protein A3D44_03230 [Candidatus Staskawiczbacteria bacterium RIFCSPHIGHO2_02_FULL_42_22]|uniref:Phosphoribosyltransferase domain-containing protein n=1 Tax=Candidatus Staskawiczbacteria bacterium RIFCSPHIGHO2_02_FULL_42_22 TaxID=1802207 RepID=A0A1G2I574_9BACT|nr:MAG: hypothetical protein A3D44_03230 [Candidatus Staskawiczbacteria bacterium RIFCSPHIGHO2_02_FULL_42_22]